MPLVILTEEAAIKPFILELAKRAGLDQPSIIVFEGKTDLDKNFVKTLRGWNLPDSRFIVLRDNDGKDCLKLKAALLEKIPADKLKNTKIRLVCQAVESWCFGDLKMLVNAGFTDDKTIATIQKQTRFTNPDDIQQPKEEFKTFFKRKFNQHVALQCAPFLSAENNSHSYNLFLKTLS